MSETLSKEHSAQTLEFFGDISEQELDRYPFGIRAEKPAYLFLTIQVSWRKLEKPP